MEWGQREQFLLSLPDDAPIPAAIENAPMLWPCNQEYFSAFSILSATRNTELAVQRISLAEIVAYCSLFKVDEPEQLVRRMLVCDDVYLEWVARQREKKTKS